MFPVPPVDQHYRKKPLYYLGSLLGHEGKGSLLSVLKLQGWAETLTAGAFISTETVALFQIDISLTEAGLAEQDTIVGLVFAAIDRVVNRGIEEWRFAELQRLGEIAFRFQERASSIATVRSLASKLHYYEPAEVIVGDYLLRAYDPALIRHFAAFLNPDNAIIAITAPEVETHQVTDYFATPYSVEAAPFKLAELPPAVARQLDLPEPNPFVPENFALKPGPVETSGSAQLLAKDPDLIKDAARIKVWFKQDEGFEVPRASTFLRIQSPEAASSLEGATLLRLYVAMVRDALNEYAYPASLAGLHHSLQLHSRGFGVVVAGYDDGQDRLFRRVIEQLQEPRFSEQRFIDIKSELLREWRNHALESPYEQLLSAVPTVIFSPWWSDEQHIEALAEIDLGDLKRFAKRIFTDGRAELLSYGNVTRQEAAKLAGMVEVELLGAMADKTLPATKVVKLEANSLRGETPVFVRSVPHNDMAVLLYLQAKDDSLIESAYMMLMQQLIRSPFFHQLRTEQQLGYVVFVSAMPFKDVPGTIMVVQSPTVSLDELMDAIKRFIDNAGELVPEDLTQHKSAVINQLLEAPTNLHEQASRYWQSIVDDDSTFDRRERLADLIEAIDSEQLGSYLANTLTRARRALWMLAGPEVSMPVPQQNSEESEVKRIWMPVDHWPIFKAERESYVYPE